MANNNAAALAGTPQPTQTGGGGNKSAPSGKPGNVLPLWGNEKTMNLNPMILTNILSSPYFKVQLYELKTYHEVVDEIYFKVNHVEPWEKGSRKTAGQTGMCGGVRGVGTGGIVSTAFCLLYKLFTLKLTRKQVMGLITHTDSPYIRALGFMYIRYTQPPTDLWDWYEDFLDDEEDLDVKAGGGCVMTIGEMLRSFLTKLEWFSTLFPRIPVPVQKHIDQQIKSRPRKVKKETAEDVEEVQRHVERRRSRSPKRSVSPRRSPRRSRSRSHHREHHGTSSFDRELERERERQRVERESKDKRRSRSNERRRSKSRERHRTRSRSRERKTDRRDKDREKENEKSRKRDYDKKGNGRDKDTERPRERSKERKRSEERKDREDRRHREDRESRKERRHSRSRSKERKQRKSRSPSKNARGRSRSKEKSNRQKEKSNKRSRSSSHGRTDSSEKSRKKERSSSRERPRKRSRSKDRSHKRDYDSKDHDRHSSDNEDKQRVKDDAL
ncbi:pre-mRNA-splicing factor 38B [Dendropsophus ebraccatus]|uniref:pre-mRNA-splicing factor 38B n=1 Tax=Dendropsophus ebraccatus TaxID=150705 RepID=UPI00383227A5